MLPIYLGLVLHLLAIASGANPKAKDDKKMLLMVEVEPIKNDARTKRNPETEGVRKERQSADVPPEYYSLLQQLAVQQHQPQQQTAASAQQPQHLIQQLVVSRDGDKQPTATRYLFSPDGRLLQESLSALGQGQQYESTLGQAQFGAELAQPQQYTRTLGVPIYVQPSPLEQTSPQTLPQAPTQPPRPGSRPRVSEYTRQQQRLLQEYREAPLRAQIAGVATGPQRPRPVQPLPTGPNSLSPQVFVPPNQNQRQPAPAPAPAQFQDPKNPGIVYTTVPVDPQVYYQQYAQFQQQQYAQVQPQYAQLPQQQFVQLPQQYAQLTQQQYTAQYAPEANQIYTQTARPSAAPQPVYYQQPESTTQTKTRHPQPVLATSSAVQPQYVPQVLPQQYLIETTKPSAQPHYVPQEVTPHVQYVQQPVAPAQPQAAPIRHEATSPSTLLQPVAGRGYFNPSKPPSRSSIYVSRSSVPKSVSLTISDGVSSEKVPVVRLPTPTTEPRTYTKQEIDALVRAGYVVTPVQDPKHQHYLKPKRQPQPASEERTNHVVYENPQDGIQYQYSPGTSDSTVTIKTKKSVSPNEYEK